MSGQPGVQIVRCHIRPSDLALVDRVVVTSAARTCLDLVRLSETDNLEKALRTRALTQAQLQVSLDLGTRMRGQRKARAARADVVDNPWSEPERAMHLLLRRAGITGWKGNVPITSNGGVRYPDITFDELKLIIEIDGRAHHGSAEAFDADHRRQDHLVTAGWTVLRFTPRQLADDPEWVIATVRATIARLRSQLID
jgi:very-short-patch-repair endonuclease